MGRERAHLDPEIELKSCHSLPIQNVISELGSDASGLQEEEAKARLRRFGYNELEQEKKPSSLVIFLRQFKNILVIILLAATVISFAVGETVDAAVILSIVFAVSLLGFFQEYRAERALEALKKMAALTATVIRRHGKRDSRKGPCARRHRDPFGGRQNSR